MDAPLFEPRIESGTSGLAARPATEPCGDLFRHLEPVRPVGADRARGAAPGPADAVEAAPVVHADHALVIGEAAELGIVGNALDRRRLIADAGDDQAAFDR